MRNYLIWLILLGSQILVGGNSFAQVQLAPVEGVRTVWLFAPVKGSTSKSKEMTDRAVHLLEKLIPALNWALTEEQSKSKEADAWIMVTGVGPQAWVDPHALPSPTSINCVHSKDGGYTDCTDQSGRLVSTDWPS